jgi:putative transposase
MKTVLTISCKLQIQNEQAFASNSVIVLENLAGIRERTNQFPRSKKERRLSNSSSFFELRSFIIYD